MAKCLLGHLFILLLFIGASDANARTCRSESDEMRCMMCNCFHESGGEPALGKELVARTVRSRIDAPSVYRKTLCGAIYQPWQYSWTLSARKLDMQLPPDTHPTMRECKAAIERAMTTDVNYCVTHFYAPMWVSAPAWATDGSMRRVREVGNNGRLGGHIYYCEKGLMDMLGDAVPQGIRSLFNTTPARSK